MKQFNLKSWNKPRIIAVGSLALIFVIVVAVFAFGKSDPETIDLQARKLTATAGNLAGDASQKKDSVIGDGDYDYTEALDHVGERATVSGVVKNIFTSKTGTVFLDFCEDFRACQFSAVIFASDVEKFGDLEQYKRDVKLTGIIKSYQGKAEIILNDPKQIE
jgi:hypothetical protein